MQKKTIKEATESWVRGFNAIPQGVIQKLIQLDDTDVQELTPPSINDKVYILVGEHNGEYGEIVGYTDDKEMYIVALDRSNTIELEADEFEVQRDDVLPIWGKMWSFDDNLDNWWLEEEDGLQKMADCGFRIYDQEDIGYFFGIDGAGYDFYEEHWVPLYKTRGLHWHDSEI